VIAGAAAVTYAAGLVHGSPGADNHVVEAVEWSRDLGPACNAQDDASGSACAAINQARLRAWEQARDDCNALRRADPTIDATAIAEFGDTVVCTVARLQPGAASSQSGASPNTAGVAPSSQATTARADGDGPAARDAPRPQPRPTDPPAPPPVDPSGASGVSFAAATMCATQRASEGPYQLGLNVQPRQPTPFSLMTFNAILSPLVTDLFEFDWYVDGRPLTLGGSQIAQMAVRDLPSTPDGSHRVSVTARGVRDYPSPDPRFRPVPRTVTVECAFRVGGPPASGPGR
jgi:hypothetical protein